MAMLLAACASIVEGTDQAILVSSVPSEATCVLEREGNQIAVVSQTPGTVMIEKSRADVAVRCSKEGHAEGASVLPSSLEAMTLGNFVFGGIVGMAVDAGSGAMHVYPSEIIVTLPPL